LDGQLHFPFSGVEGIALGERVALETLRRFDENWNKYSTDGLKSPVGCKDCFLERPGARLEDKW
jgi:hypothetical protein